MAAGGSEVRGPAPARTSSSDRFELLHSQSEIFRDALAVNGVGSEEMRDLSQLDVATRDALIAATML